MKLVPLVKAMVLAAAAFDLARVLLTRDGIGPVEWAVGIAGFVALAAGAAHFSRRAFGAASG